MLYIRISINYLENIGGKDIILRIGKNDVSIHVRSTLMFHIHYPTYFINKMQFNNIIECFLLQLYLRCMELSWYLRSIM